MYLPSDLDDQCSNAALSSLIFPRTCGQTPTKARAKVDFPAPLGPIMPSASPLFSENDTSESNCFSEPGAATQSCSTVTTRVGRGNLSGSSSLGKSWSS